MVAMTNKDHVFSSGNLPKSALINFALNTAIGSVLAAIFGEFWVTMLYSHAIGWSIFGLSSAFSRWRYPSGKLPAGGIAILVTIMPLLGLLLGLTIARTVQGKEVSFAYLSSVLASPTVLITFLASGAAVWFFWTRQSGLFHELEVERQKTQAEALQRQLSEAQLGLLRTQVEPHMLFNTLANLRALITLDAKAAVVMLDHLNDFLRASLTSSRQQKIQLREEFKLIANYLELMKVRLAQRMEYRLELPADLETAKLPPWLLQPLVENAIKHGLEPSANGGAIHVSAQQVGQFLALRVHNTGQLLPDNFDLNALTTKPDSGLGLVQCRDRIALIYGQAATMKVISLPDQAGTLVSLEIPLEND
jgi:sensor histidine kinase YesM